VFARILILAPDIKTSLQSSASRFGFDMQSLLFWIFPGPGPLLALLAAYEHAVKS